MADTMAENMLKTNNDINTDAEIWQRVRAGEMSARERLVEANMQLVFWLARRFMGRGFCSACCRMRRSFHAPAFLFSPR